MFINQKSLNHGERGYRLSAGQLKRKPSCEAMPRVDEGAFPANRLEGKLPLYTSTVCAGFPSPADDYIETHLDLAEYLIAHQASTFLLRASGDSMIGAGIHSGDLLVVDRSLTPVSGKIVIAALNGELTVKRLSTYQGCVRLLAENTHYPPIDITEAVDFVIWGVVTYIIHPAH